MEVSEGVRLRRKDVEFISWADKFIRTWNILTMKVECDRVYLSTLYGSRITDQDLERLKRMNSVYSDVFRARAEAVERVFGTNV